VPHYVWPPVSNGPTAAYVWMNVAAPSNAVFLVFDFRIEGDPQEDSIVMGVNGSNVFSLAAKFVATNEWTSSGPIDATRYAGRTNELFFGLLGGTSANCTLTIDSIRFQAFASPQLAIQTTNNVTTITWPAALVGYQLETTESLSSPQWQAITNGIVNTNGQFILTNEFNMPANYYRLHLRE
jgi:hypothetical protein